jgi:hypothetical protein
MEIASPAFLRGSNDTPADKMASRMAMITDDEKIEILNKAYVPEHSVELISLVSGGEPFLFQDYFCCRTEDGLILIGYPLGHDFGVERFDRVLTEAKEVFNPAHISLIAPELPASLAKICSERESDYYYTLDLAGRTMRAGLQKVCAKAALGLVVERSAELGAAHRALAEEFASRVELPPQIKELLFRMWNYVGRSDGSLVLSAWDRRGKLAAFYVMDMSPVEFSTYIIGCHSKQDFAQGASDLLFFEMIKVSTEHSKKYIHLGLGVNKGIRQFKKKWGGASGLPYESCELPLKKFSFWDSIIEAAYPR